MKKIIGILLVGLLGFSGCSSSEAENTSGYSVQAVGLVAEYGLSVSAYVMDQEENLSSDAMLTINDEPMNIGFFAVEDLNKDREEILSSDASDHPLNGVPSGDYQPYYFLDLLDLNEGDTVNFVAKGNHGRTLYSTSAEVPEKITLIEPPPDATFLPGQEVYIKWEGGEPTTCYEVLYVGGDGEFIYSSDILEQQGEHTIPAGVIRSGAGFLFLSGFDCQGAPVAHTDPASSSVTYNFLEIADCSAGTGSSEENVYCGKQFSTWYEKCKCVCDNLYTQCVAGGGAWMRICGRYKHNPNLLGSCCGGIERAGCYKQCLARWCPGA